MSTVYIDVYFLINFTVDLLAFHLASAFSKVNIKSIRLFVGAFLSALYACIILFIPMHALLMLALSATMLILTSYVLTTSISALRRFKLIVAFVLFLTIIGGAVYLVFDCLEAYFPQYVYTDVQNRKLLILSVIVLLAIAIIRLLLALFFHTKSEKYAHLSIEYNGVVLQCDALVDSGNLLKDPIDLTPVMLIKTDAVRKLFPRGIPTLDSFDSGAKLDRHVRLIPINKSGQRTLTLGIRPERVMIMRGREYAETKLTFIIDDEEGSFGGYEALIPAAALENL